MTLPLWLSATVAWSLLLAYVATGSSVIGGFYHYANLLLHDATGHVYSTVLLATLVTGVSIWIAYRDVKISARLMLWIEATSVTVIVIVVALLLVRHGWHLDVEQVHLHGMTGSGLRLGLVLALFSFVGFESATTLGSEARNPLKTIPRAVIQSAVLAGAFFTVCAYAEVLGFHTVGQDLGASQAPMYVLAQVGGIPVLGLLIDIGALVSMFAGTLACITAAARVLMLMAHHGLAHDSLQATHAKNQTPSRAVIITGAAALLPVAVLAARGASGLDVYGWLGSLATYGFIVAYALVCVALPRYLRDHKAFRRGAQIVPWLAGAAMLLALVGNLYPGQRNIFRQPWQRRADIEVLKAMQMTERHSLKFKLDVFNLTNTASFDIPIENITQNINFNGFPSVGQPATTTPCDTSFTALYQCPSSSGIGITNKTISSPRQIQMSLSLTF
jgi:amino acid transporter